MPSTERKKHGIMNVNDSVNGSSNYNSAKAGGQMMASQFAVEKKSDANPYQTP